MLLVFMYRELADHIWTDVLTNELRSHMSLFSDDFVRCICLAHAIGMSGDNVEVAFRSGAAFAKALQRSLVLCFQMFFAYKIHTLPQYNHLLTTPEFPVIDSDSEPEDDDDDYMSDKEEEDENVAGTADGDNTPSSVSIEKQSSVGIDGMMVKEEEERNPDPVFALQEKRRKRNRFYGLKVSFLFVKQQK